MKWHRPAIPMAIRKGGAAGFLLLVNALYFLPVLMAGNGAVLSAAGKDTWTQFYYWRQFAFESLAGGEWPLWNPYVFSGTPFVAGIQSAVFYPLNWIFLFLPTAFAINLSIALHCFLASFFTYLYARYIGIGPTAALLSGVTFAYGAPYFFHIYAGHLPHLCTMVWLPLLFLGVESLLQTKQILYAVLTGIVLAVQLFAGFPQYQFYSLIGLTVYFLVRILAKRDKDAFRLVRGYVVFLAVGALLSAAQWLPTAELSQHSFREALSFEWAALFSLPPEKLWTLLIPDLFGNMTDLPYWGKNYLWEMSVYLGVIPLALAVFALVFDLRGRVVAFSVVALFALLFAFGKYTPLLKLLFTYVPGFDKFRGIAKFVFVYSFATALLAGFGLGKLSELAETKSPWLTRLSWGFLIVPGILFLLVLVGPFPQTGWWGSLMDSYIGGVDRFSAVPPLTLALVQQAVSTALASLLKSCLLLTLLGGCLLLWSKRQRLRGLLAAVILLLAVADLWQFGARYLVVFSPSEIHLESELKTFLEADREPFRIASPLDKLVNVGIYERLENVGGYDTLVLKKYDEYINFANGLPVGESSTDIRTRTTSPLLDLLNAKYFILDGSSRVERPGFKLVFDNSRYRVYRNPHALPRSFIVHDAVVINDRDEALQRMTSPGFNPRATAIVEENIALPKADPSVESPAPKFIERSLNRVVLEAAPKAAGLLVLADAYYPGWRVFVDGKESKLYPTNYVMRSVLIPAGTHSVEFRYDPLSFKIGASITLVTLMGVVGWLAWALRRKSNS